MISHCMLVLYTLATFGQVFVKSIKEVNQTNQNQNIYFFNWTLECKRTKSLHSPHVLQQKSKNFIHQLSTPSSSAPLIFIQEIRSVFLFTKIKIKKKLNQFRAPALPLSMSDCVEAHMQL